MKGKELFTRTYQKMHNLFRSNIKKVTRIDKKGKEISKSKSYRLQFIDTARFIARSLSNLVNSLCEGIHKIRCKYELNDKKM